MEACKVLALLPLLSQLRIRFAATVRMAKPLNVTFQAHIFHHTQPVCSLGFPYFLRKVARKLHCEETDVSQTGFSLRPFHAYSSRTSLLP